jgi:hypothetical protein
MYATMNHLLFDLLTCKTLSSFSDSGLYTCVAKNVIGRTHSAAYLAVNAALANQPIR